MARWITIIAILSIGLNVGLAAAVGLGLYRKSGAERDFSIRSAFQNFDTQLSPQQMRECRQAARERLPLPEGCPQLGPQGQRGDGQGPGRRQPPMRLNQLAQELGLSDPQRRQFRQMLDGRRDLRRQLNQDLGGIRSDLLAELSKDDVDTTRALELWSRSVDRRNQALTRQAERTLELYADLSPEQRQKLRDWTNGDVLRILE